MTGPEHYREAERLLGLAASPAGEAEGVERTVAAAQVHATLALAAAQAETFAWDVSDRTSDYVNPTWAEAIS